MSSAALVGCAPAGADTSAAWGAGLRTGDTVLAVDGTTVRTWSQMVNAYEKQPKGSAK